MLIVTRMVITFLTLFVFDLFSFQMGSFLSLCGYLILSFFLFFSLLILTSCVKLKPRWRLFPRPFLQLYLVKQKSRVRRKDQREVQRHQIFLHCQFLLLYYYLCSSSLTPIVCVYVLSFFPPNLLAPLHGAFSSHFLLSSIRKWPPPAALRLELRRLRKISD